MNFLRVLSRVALLTLAAAAFAGLTDIYGRSVGPASPNPGWQTDQNNCPAGPNVHYFLEFAGESYLFIFFTAIGRIGLRLRLSPLSRSERQPISLGLQRLSQGRE